jgi:hypothetical protein
MSLPNTALQRQFKTISPLGTPPHLARHFEKVAASGCHPMDLNVSPF